MKDSNKNFYAKLSANKKFQLLFFCIAMGLLFAIYLPVTNRIATDVLVKNALNQETTIESGFVSRVENIEKNDNGYELSGWAFRADSEVIELAIILKDILVGEEQVIETKLVKNDAVNERIRQQDLEGTTKGSGFYSTFQEIEGNNSCYEIEIYMKYRVKVEKEDGFKWVEEKKRFSTHQYLFAEQVYAYNPFTFTEPEINDEQIVYVISEGTVCGYIKEYGTWVYYHDNNLYWILDNEVEINRNEHIRMYLHLYTSLVTKLPEDNRVHGFNNNDFNFEANIVHCEDDGFRVAKISLENMDYPVTYISTGYYDEAERSNLWSVFSPILE